MNRAIGIPAVVAAVVLAGCYPTHEPENGVELAEVTPMIAERFPDDHKLLADGTWDSYTAAERSEFGFRLLRESTGTEPGEEMKAAMLKLEEIASSMPEPDELIEEMLIEYELFMLGEVERMLRMERHGFIGAVREMFTILGTMVELKLSEPVVD